ncbi:unnamed protein product, partial [Linum tenue]
MILQLSAAPATPGFHVRMVEGSEVGGSSTRAAEVEITKTKRKVENVKNKGKEVQISETGKRKRKVVAGEKQKAAPCGKRQKRTPGGGNEATLNYRCSPKEILSHIRPPLSDGMKTSKENSKLAKNYGFSKTGKGTVAFDNLRTCMGAVKSDDSRWVNMTTMNEEEASRCVINLETTCQLWSPKLLKQRKAAMEKKFGKDFGKVFVPRDAPIFSTTRPKMTQSLSGLEVAEGEKGAGIGDEFPDFNLNLDGKTVQEASVFTLLLGVRVQVWNKCISRLLVGVRVQQAEWLAWGSWSWRAYATTVVESVASSSLMPAYVRRLVLEAL